MLEKDTIDIMIGLRATFITMKNMDFFTIKSGEMQLVTAKSTPLAEKPFVSIEDIKDMKLILQSNRSNPDVYNMLVKLMTRHGAREENLLNSANTINSLISVSSGECVMLIPAGGRREIISGADVVCLPVVVHDSAMGLLDEVAVKKQSTRIHTWKYFCRSAEEYRNLQGKEIDENGKND